MIIKKFQGKTEEEATLLAQKELGSGAVIMNVKTLKKKGFFAIFRPPLIEVTAAVEEETDNPPVKPRIQAKPKFEGVIMDDEPEPSKVPERPSESKDIEAKLESLHSLIEERLVKEEDRLPEIASDAAGKPNEMVQFFKLIYSTLIENEVDEKYANELLGEIERINKAGITMDHVLSNIYQKMILQFGETERITPASDGAKVIYFVGPTGVGKTTTIAKIASILTVSKKKKVALLTTDTYRIAAADQLKTYANILNVPFEIVYTAEELLSASEKYADRDYILVDTAGHSPNNSELREGTVSFLSALPEETEKDVFLVVSATTKYKDLLHIADMYMEMTKFRLIFTKLDETECFGNLLNLKLYTGAGISYVTCGQNVPDDIQAFNPQSTVKKLLGGKQE